LILKDSTAEVNVVRWRQFLTIIGVSLVIALGTAVWNQMNYERSILQIATAPDFCPYEFIDTTSGSNQLVGFDVDLARAVADSMEYRPIFTTMPFSSLLPTLRSQRVDFAMSAITPTEERQKVVNFSSVYYEAQSVIIIRKGSAVQSLADISGKRIGVKPKTVHEQLAKTVPDGEIVPFDHTSDVLQELKTGRIDVAIIDRAIAKKHINRQSEFKRIVLENEQPAGVAAAFPQESPLLKGVNQELKRLRRNGTIEALVLQWFDDYVCPTQEQEA
jgi:polar amino acid transport system substrate-binding protein